MLARVANMYKALFEVCRNGVIPKKLFDMALEALHLSSKIYFDKEPIELWAPNAGLLLKGAPCL